MKVISWRNAIQKAKLESTTKLVLFNLSVHMNDAGESCFPSVDLQSKYTCLSKRCIIQHLKKAEKAGFIKVSKHGYGDQRWARNEYYATFPENMELNNDNLIEEGGYSDSPPLQKGGYLGSKGGYPDDKKVVTHGNTNMTNITLHDHNKRKVKEKKYNLSCLENSPVQDISSPVVCRDDRLLSPQGSTICAPVARKSAVALILKSEAAEAFDMWNDFAKKYGLQCAMKLNSSRASKLNSRLKDCGGIEGWKNVLQKIADSPFCLGDNNRGWKANLDFVLQESSFLKLMEGCYDRNNNNQRRPKSGLMQAFENEFGVVKTS